MRSVSRDFRDRIVSTLLDVSDGISFKLRSVIPPFPHKRKSACILRLFN